MEKDTDNLLFNPFSDESSFGGEYKLPKTSSVSQTVIKAAQETALLRLKHGLPTEEELCSKGYVDERAVNEQEVEGEGEEACSQNEKDLQISLRVALQGFFISLVDSAPSEIAVLTLKNVNAIATWNVKRTADATVFITVTDLQVDNMIPNAPFPVAISPNRKGTSTLADEAERGAKTSETDMAPVLVVGLSFAPRHKTGTVVRLIFRKCI
jgi:hypothetical protein